MIHVEICVMRTYLNKHQRSKDQGQWDKPLSQSRTEILGWTEPERRAGEWPDEGAHTPHRGCCCLDSQLCSSYTATLRGRAHCKSLCNLRIEVNYYSYVCLSLTRVGRRRNRHQAFLNVGGCRSESRPLAGRAEDGSHLVHCGAMRALPGRQRRTGGKETFTVHCKLII